MEGFSNSNRGSFEKVNVNESLVKYLAGLMDADGCLQFTFRPDHRRKQYACLGLKLYLGASEKIDRHGFVRSLPETTGMGAVYKQQTCHFMWIVGRRNHLEMLLPRLIKHMVVKARHWQWMLEVWREVRSRKYGERSLHRDQIDLLVEEYKQSRRKKVGPLKPKNYPSWAWVAGYLDGDGWYLHRKPRAGRYGMHVGASAHVTDASVLAFLQKAFGGKIKNHSQSDNVRVWERSLSNANRSFALRFLPKVAKHSRLKRHKIDLMIHHHQQRLSVQGPTG